MSRLIKRIVENLIQKNKITKFPIPVEKIAKKLGIDLNYSVFEDTISGFLYNKEGNYIISINSLHPKVRQRFTIAHELGHFCLNHDGSLFIDKGNLYRKNARPEGNLKIEREANKFAAELLMPEKMLEELIENDSIEDIEDLTHMADKLQVSTQALTYRLSNLGYTIY